MHRLLIISLEYLVSISKLYSIFAVNRKSTQSVGKGHFFLVMESCLLLLFKFCDLCMGPVEAVVWKTVGTFIRIRKQCRDCGSITFWDSQEFVSSIPEGNLKLSAGILFSGSKPSQALRLFNHIKCPVITLRTFTRHQTKWLHPVVNRLWSTKQSAMMEGLKEIGVAVNLGGDGRSDSPGHSAKYGSYTFIDLDWNMVLHQELVQVCFFFFVLFLFVCLFVNKQF